LEHVVLFGEHPSIVHPLVMSTNKSCQKLKKWQQNTKHKVQNKGGIVHEFVEICTHIFSKGP